eukprot:11708617-Karenia_brevis.AAC.1
MDSPDEQEQDADSGSGEPKRRCVTFDIEEDGLETQEASQSTQAAMAECAGTSSADASNAVVSDTAHVWTAMHAIADTGDDAAYAAAVRD